MNSSSQSTLVEKLRTLNEQKPDALAFTELNGRGETSASISYSELYRRVGRLAGGLSGRGLRGERVVLAYSTGVDFAAAFFACLSAGAVPVCVQPPRREQSWSHLNAVIEDCTPKLCLSKKRLETSLRWLSLGELEDEPLMQPAEPGALAHIQYTSGTTSRPRGAMVTHANLAANNRAIELLCNQTEGITLVSWLPVFHDMGLVAKVLQAVHLGGHCVLINPGSFLVRPRLWLEAVSKFRAHTSGAPNFAFQLAVEKIPEAELGAYDLSCWKTAFCAAEPVRWPTLRSFGEKFSVCGFDPAALKPAYGLAEFTLTATVADRPTTPYLDLDPVALGRGEIVESRTGVRYVNCGRPASDTRVSILGSDGEEVEGGRAGEVTLSGPSHTPGYWKAPDSSPLLRTGDIGFLRQGELFLVGRKKHILIVAGRNVHPEDIEQTACRALPDLRTDQVAAYSFDDGHKEHLILAVESRRNVVDIEKIRQLVSQVNEVSLDHVLAVPLGTLPRSSSGKVKRNECARLLPLPAVRAPDPPCLRDIEEPVERFLCRKIATELKCSYVDPGTRFDRLGLASVFRFSLMGELSQVLGVPVAGDATWVYLTPRALAASLKSRTEDFRVFKLGRPGPLVLLPAVSGGLAWAEGLVSALPPGLTVVGVRQGSSYHESLESFAREIVDGLVARYSAGPYVLIGYSEFSRLAFEVARQLESDGCQVRQFVSIDGSGLDWRRMPLWEYWRQFWIRLLWQAVEVFRERGPEGVLKGLKGAAVNCYKIVKGRLYPDEVTHIFTNHEVPVENGPNASTAQQNLKLARQYRPKVFGGRLLLYRVPSNNFSGAHMKAGGWDGAVKGTVEIVDLEGTHTSLLRPPLVDFIAGDISRRLELHSSELNA